MILAPLKPPQPEHGEGSGTMLRDGPIDFWSIGSLDGKVVFITERGHGWMGDPCGCPPFVPMDQPLLPFHDVPALPADGDGPGWDAWAATIRERIAAGGSPGQQLSIFA